LIQERVGIGPQFLRPLLWSGLTPADSLPTSGSGRSLSLAKKLELLNLNYEPSQVNLPSLGLEDNPQNITLFFFIGFFKGDGFLALIPVWSETHTRLIFNPRLVLTQKAKDSNINLMNKIKKFLESFINVDVLLYVDKPSETQDVGAFRLIVGSSSKMRTVKRLFFIKKLFLRST
jgi:hypothetical protein